jgi:hypothetical protein
MPQGRRALIALATLLVFLWGATGVADSDMDELECIPGQPYEHSFEGDEVSYKGPTVPRNMVVLEVFGRPT